MTKNSPNTPKMDPDALKERTLSLVEAIDVVIDKECLLPIPGLCIFRALSFHMGRLARTMMGKEAFMEACEHLWDASQPMPPGSYTVVDKRPRQTTAGD